MGILSLNAIIARAIRDKRLTPEKLDSLEERERRTLDSIKKSPVAAAQYIRKVARRNSRWRR